MQISWKRLSEKDETLAPQYKNMYVGVLLTLTFKVSLRSFSALAIFQANTFTLMILSTKDFTDVPCASVHRGYIFKFEI